MRGHLQKFLSALALAATAVAVAAGTQTAQPMTGRDPLEVAKVLAARYPAQPIMSYIPALSWSGQLRLSALTGDTQWREKALKDIAAFTSGGTPAIAEPYRLTSLAGALAFADAATLAGDKAAGELAAKVADVMMPDDVDGSVKFATGWTDDMFMAAAVLARTATPASRGRGSTAAADVLVDTAARRWTVRSCAEGTARVGTRQRLCAAGCDRSADASARAIAGPRQPAADLSAARGGAGRTPI